ncbi:MAG: sigma-E processing peptidase SpoIIGA [Clostridia bacterium]
MEVYIETVILNNFFVDMFVLMLTLTTLRLPLVWWRILLGSLIGCVFGVVYPLITFGYTFFLKVGVGLIMSLVMARYSSLKKCIVGILAFFGYTFALGGVTYGMTNLLANNFAQSFPSDLLPFFVGSGLVFLIIAYKIFFAHIIDSKRMSAYSTKVVLYANGKTIECDGFRDSGNRAYYKGKYPIIMINKAVFLQLFGENNVKEKYAEIKTIVGKKYLQVFPLEKIYIAEENCFVDNVMVALSEQNIDGCDALLHCDI